MPDDYMYVASMGLVPNIYNVSMPKAADML